MLGIATPISHSTDYEAPGKSAERVLNLCRAAGADRYLSGPAAKAYLDRSPFAAAGIEVAWMDYSGYPEYPQLYPPFDHAVTVLDLIFNTGSAAPRFMKMGRKPALKVCLACGERFESEGWTCPRCGSSPSGNGFPSFAPELSDPGFEADWFEPSRVSRQRASGSGAEQARALGPRDVLPRRQQPARGRLRDRVRPGGDQGGPSGPGVDRRGRRHGGTPGRSPSTARGPASSARRPRAPVRSRVRRRRRARRDRAHRGGRGSCSGQMHAATRPGGGVLVLVPQHPWLWSPQADAGHTSAATAARELDAKVASGRLRGHARHLVRVAAAAADGGRRAGSSAGARSSRTPSRAAHRAAAGAGARAGAGPRAGYDRARSVPSRRAARCSWSPRGTAELWSYIPFNRAHVVGPELSYVEEAIANGHISGERAVHPPLPRLARERRRAAAKALLTHSCTGALEMAAMLAGDRARATR